MASMASKLARAAFATRASPSAVGATAGAGRPAAAISDSPTDAIRISPVEGPNYRKIYPNPPVDENVFKSKEAMWAFYEYWCKYHGISRDRREMVRRFKGFSNTARRVYEFNTSSSYGGLAMNHLADATNEERKLLRGYRPAKK
ncbi:thiol protease SEN102-like isoform X1 [Lolium rigidum]|uniref:thiol protease SEN102-like isoform X1 n=1 Tax=Lolium rigidum TaxID=89674 RepID=UPI001F5C7C0E|nr:thiol protease SEN102-like isoform X1 [Lolium rigidum]